MPLCLWWLQCLWTVIYINCSVYNISVCASAVLGFMMHVSVHGLVFRHVFHVVVIKVKQRTALAFTSPLRLSPPHSQWVFIWRINPPCEENKRGMNPGLEGSEERKLPPHHRPPVHQQQGQTKWVRTSPDHYYGNQPLALTSWVHVSVQQTRGSQTLVLQAYALKHSTLTHSPLEHHLRGGNRS